MSEELPEGLRAFVEDDVALLPSGLTEAERAQLIAVLLERHDASRLDRLGSSPDKSLAKAARRALHLLRTRGAAPVVAPPRVFRVEGPYAKKEEPPSWATIIDGMGERIVWYVEETPRGVAIYESEVSEGRGLLSLTAVEAPKKSWRERLQIMQKSERAILGPIPAIHARVLIERAFRRTREVGRTPPEEYARLRRVLQIRDEALEQPHPLRTRLGDVDPASVTDDELMAILDRPELSMFAPPQAALEALDNAIKEVVLSNGGQELEPAQRREQVETAIARVVDETMTAELRARMAARLLEMGLLILSRDPDGGGPAAARACLVAADRSLDVAIAPHDHPTLLQIYRRLVNESALEGQ